MCLIDVAVPDGAERFGAAEVPDEKLVSRMMKFGNVETDGRSHFLEGLGAGNRCRRIGFRHVGFEPLEDRGFAAGLHSEESDFSFGNVGELFVETLDKREHVRQSGMSEGVCAVVDVIVKDVGGKHVI